MTADRHYTASHYTRCVFFMRNEGPAPLTEMKAAKLIGYQMSFTLDDIHLSTGEVTGFKLLENGNRLQVTVESGGRHCWACGMIYTDEWAPVRLVPLSRLRKQSPDVYLEGGYDVLPGSALVCVSPSDCWQRSNGEKVGPEDA